MYLIPISIPVSDNDNDVMSFPSLSFTTRFLQTSNSFLDLLQVHLTSF